MVSKRSLLMYSCLICASLVLPGTSGVSGRTTVYVGGLFELTDHWWSSYTNLFPLILENAFEAISNRTDILMDYDIELIRADTKGQGGLAAKQMINLIQNGPPKVAIFGPGLSDELTITGQIAPFYKVIELSYVATTATTVNEELFPSLFTVNQVTKALNPLRIKMMEFFSWTRVGTIAFQNDMSTAQMNDFHAMLKTNNMTLVTSAVIADIGSIKAVMARFKQFDVRIIMGAFRSSVAAAVFCEAYRQGMYGGSHVWILAGPTIYANWIRNSDLTGLNCKREELITASNGHFMLNYHVVSKSDKPTVIGKTAAEIQSDLDALKATTPFKLTSYAGWIYDTALAFVIGLNNSLKYLDEAGLSLANYTYSEDYLAAIKTGMHEVTFQGMSGPVSFDNTGFRLGLTFIQQNYNDTVTDVASYDTIDDNLTWYIPVEDLWNGGAIPQDRFIYRESVVNITDIAFGSIVILAAAGCLLTTAFLTFNVYFRNNRSIKMSSPMINNAIMAGCMILYVQVFVTSYDFKFATLEGGDKMCMGRVWLMAFGFTLLFGAMFSKTYRVYVIFRDSAIKSKVIKDFHLFGLIGALLLIDCLLLFPWSLISPLTTHRQVELSQDISDQNVIYSRVYLYCDNVNQGFWFAAIYVYKGLLLAFGTFLAWETRNVKVQALNDSKYIGACIYNVVVMCVSGVPMAHMLPINMATLAYVLSAALILFCTTLCQCIIFIPKIQARNQVHGRFLMNSDNTTSTDQPVSFTSATTKVTAAPSSSNVISDDKDQSTSVLKEENENLRMQIANESIAMAKLKRKLLEITGNVHLYKSGSDYVVFKSNTNEDNLRECAVEDIA